jgi:hypothetical protein
MNDDTNRISPNTANTFISDQVDEFNDAVLKLPSLQKQLAKKTLIVHHLNEGEFLI